MTQLIANDVARCINHKCLLRLQCKRYLQIKMEQPFPYEPANNKPYALFQPEGNQLDNAHCSHQLPYHHAN